jgi:RimJ/RimL family protein N-acetyltransferase
MTEAHYPELTYPIETERLLLRPTTMDDLDALHDLHRRDEVTRDLPWESRSRDEMRRELEERARKNVLRKNRDEMVLGAVLREPGDLIGELYLLLRTVEYRGGEIGYVFHPDYYGHGYATEAARAGLKIGFEQFGWHRIEASCVTRNERSWRLMERLGMRREAHFRANEFFKGEWTDDYLYALLEWEWQEMSQRS